jgi:predicted dehydrogenase
VPVQICDYKVGQSPAYGGVYGEAFLRDFILAAQGKAEVPASGRDALQVARVIDAAYESSRTGRRIDIPAPDIT